MGDVYPAGAGADRDGAMVLGEGDGGEVGQVEGYAVGDVGCTGEGRVAAGFDGEGGAEVGEDLDCFGDVPGGGGRDEAGRRDLRLAGRPVAVLLDVVGGGGGEGYEVREG